MGYNDFFPDPNGQNWDPNPVYRPLPWKGPEGDGFTDPHDVRNTIDLTGELSSIREAFGLSNDQPQDMHYDRLPVPDATPPSGIQGAIPGGLDFMASLATMLGNRKRRKQGRPTREMPGPVATQMARAKQFRREQERKHAEEQNLKIGNKESVANATRQDAWRGKKESAMNALLPSIFARMHPSEPKAGETEKRLETMRKSKWFMDSTPEQQARYEQQVLGAAPKEPKAAPKSLSDIENESAARARGTVEGNPKSKADPYGDVKYLGDQIQFWGKELGNPNHPEVLPRSLASVEARRKGIATLMPAPLVGKPAPMRDIPGHTGPTPTPTSAPLIQQNEGVGQYSTPIRPISHLTVQFDPADVQKMQAKGVDMPKLERQLQKFSDLANSGTANVSRLRQQFIDATGVDPEQYTEPDE